MNGLRAEFGKEEEPAKTDMVSAVVEQPPSIDESELDVRDFVTPDELNKLTVPVNQFCNRFPRPTTEISCTPVTKMRVERTTDDIVKYRSYRLPHSEKEIVRGMAIELEDAGIVKDSNSDFASPVMLVMKKT